MLSAAGLLTLPYVAYSDSLISKTGGSLRKENHEEKERTKEDWFDEYFSSKPSVGALHVFRFADEMYATTKPISWIPAKGDQETTFKQVDVPTGFVTDFASVPRIFWQFLPRDGKYTYPAIVHDYMYWVQDRPRDSADEIFRIGMQEFGVDPIVLNAVYWGVRAGGSIAWNTNAAVKAKGERRILKRFPTDPLAKWENWKKEADVFMP